MPELPEVETTVRDLKKKVLGKTIVEVWTDVEKFKKLKGKIEGKKIKKIWRRGKNILFDLSENKTLLIHQKLTGHLLFGKWHKQNNKWQPPSGFLSEKINTYIHLLFTFNNGQMLALSDLRKFAKAELWDRKTLKESEEIKNLGPEPLEKSFTLEKFKTCLIRKKGKIKEVLMDQTVIAGIGNIYSDEILWEAKIHPFKEVSKLSKLEINRIYQAIKKILSLAIKLQGESISDFRRLSGEKGFYDQARKVYRREGENCRRCQTKIKRIKLAGRSAHFCPKCQPY